MSSRRFLLELSRNQVVVSRRGKFGGYTLARPPAEVTFAQVIRIIDGPLALAPCVSPHLGFRKCADCSDIETCTLREALDARPRRHRRRAGRPTTLADAAGGLVRVPAA